MSNYEEPDASDYVGEEPVAKMQTTLPAPVNWWILSDEEKAIHLARVTNFTLRLVTSYRLGPEFVPPCWHLHDELIQELLALTQYRNDQQFISDQAPGAAIDFHEKFAVWRQRMRQWVSEAGCKGYAHEEKAIPSWALEGSDAFAEAEDSRIETVDSLMRKKDN